MFEKKEQNLKHIYFSAFVALMLLAATLACTLTREDPPEPTPTLTPDFQATVIAGGGEITGPPPELAILEISPPSPIDLGQTVQIDVQARHPSALTSIIFEVARLDELEDDDDPQFQSVEARPIEGGQLDVQRELLWQPFVDGRYTLRVVAFSNTGGTSDPFEVDVAIVTPEPPPGGADGGANAPPPQPCMISPKSGSITLRSNPADTASSTGTLGEGQSGLASEIGRDQSWQGWYLIDVEGNVSGWAKGTLVTSEGDCIPGVHLTLRE